MNNAYSTFKVSKTTIRIFKRANTFKRLKGSYAKMLIDVTLKGLRDFLAI